MKRQFFDSSQYTVLRCYRLKSPDGVFLEGEHATKEEIPDEVWSRDMSFRYQSEDCVIVEGWSVRPKEAG